MKYLSISLFHPEIKQGGAQNVAYDLFLESRAGIKNESFFLAATTEHISPHLYRVCSPIVRYAGRSSEYLLFSERFDYFYHTNCSDRMLRNIEQFVVELAPDIIHVHHSLLIGLDIIKFLKIRFQHIPIVYTLHDFLPICHNDGHLVLKENNSICRTHNYSTCPICFKDISEDAFFLRKKNFLDVFSLVNAFITPTNFVKDIYSKWGINEDRICVIPNGDSLCACDSSAYGKMSDKVNVYSFFGQFIECKGICLLVEAFKNVALSNPGLQFVLNLHGGDLDGDSSDFSKKIKELIHTLPGNIIANTTGHYSREDIEFLMEASDWVVLPSTWPETFVLTLSEAWKYGRPVIASNCGAFIERIKNNHNGLLFTRNDVNALANCIKSTCGNKRLWKKINKNIPRLVSSKEAWEMHERLFSDILGSAPNNPVPKTDLTPPRLFMKAIGWMRPSRAVRDTRSILGNKEISELPPES